MNPINPEEIRYIKLGRGGIWTQPAFERGEIHFGYRGHSATVATPVHPGQTLNVSMPRMYIITVRRIISGELLK